MGKRDRTGKRKDELEIGEERDAGAAKVGKDKKGRQFGEGYEEERKKS